MKKILLGTIGPVALAMAFSCAAYAGEFGNVSATLSGSYASSSEAVNGDESLYGFKGTFQVPFDVGLADVSGVEATTGYVTNDDGDFWNYGGALYAGGAAGRVAVGYMYLDNPYGDGVNVFNGGGEWFVTPEVTLAVRGGGASFEQEGGGYLGGQGTWYVIPDVAVSASFDYGTFVENMTTETLKVEWLVSEKMPIAIYGGYQHVSVGGGGGDDMADIFFVGLKLFVNCDGAATLADRERTGSLGYINQPPIFYTMY